MQFVWIYSSMLKKRRRAQYSRGVDTAVCVRALQMCVSVHGKLLTSARLQHPERFICSPRAFVQCLYRVLIREIERECNTVMVMHRRTLYENVDGQNKGCLLYYRYRYFMRGIDASYRHTLYRYIDEFVTPLWWHMDYLPMYYYLSVSLIVVNTCCLRRVRESKYLICVL